MSGINKVIILGNLGKDIDYRFLPSGGGVANITVATSETWKDKQTGEQKEKTEWHKVVVFGKLAEVANQYLKKGSKVYFEGALQTRKWTNQQGQDQYTTEIVVQGFNATMEMLDSRNGGSNNSQPAAAQQQNQQVKPVWVVTINHPNGQRKNVSQVKSEANHYNQQGYAVQYEQ